MAFSVFFNKETLSSLLHLRTEKYNNTGNKSNSGNNTTSLSLSATQYNV